MFGDWHMALRYSERHQVGDEARAWRREHLALERCNLVQRQRTHLGAGTVTRYRALRLLLERAYAVLREYCFYYGALMPAFGSGLVSFTARQALLVCVRGLYIELAEIQRIKVDLQGEDGIDVQAYFASPLSEWIEALNTEAPQYAVEPLLLPQ